MTSNVDQIGVVLIRRPIRPPFTHQAIALDLAVVPGILGFGGLQDVGKVRQVCGLVAGESASSSEEW